MELQSDTFSRLGTFRWNIDAAGERVATSSPQSCFEQRSITHHTAFASFSQLYILHAHSSAQSLNYYKSAKRQRIYSPSSIDWSII
jgi:hypothetical protein